jgi:2-dehydropantoate 2-reductase
MKLCIIGAGAVGTFLAAHLAGHAHVTLVDRQCQATERATVEVTGQFPITTEVQVSSHPVAADWALVTTKATALPEVCESLKGWPTPVVFWQNGIGVNDVVLADLPGVSLARGFIWAGVTRTGVRQVRCNGFSRIALGKLRGEYVLEPLANGLRASGLSVDLSTDPTCLEWEKAMWNIGVNGLCAITNELNGAVVDSPFLCAVLGELIHEAEQVASCVGCNFNLVESVIRLTRATATNVNSMLADLQRGQYTEIEFLNGHVIRLAERFGVPVPCNEVVYRLVKHLESRVTPLSERTVLR